MKTFKIFGIVVAIAGVVALALIAVPSSYGQPVAVAQGGPVDSAQDRPGPRIQRSRHLTILRGPGAQIGVSTRDLEPAEADRMKVKGGAVIEEVRASSAADKAGLKKSDVVVEFDGERVRSARQFGRLVQETPPGRIVKGIIVRDGRRTNVSIALSAEPQAGAFIDRQLLRDRIERLGRFANRLPPLDFNFDDLSGLSSRARLGVVVEDLTPQLASYFGARDGVLVAAVTDDSPAGRAGLKAGDVITSVNGERVASRADLLRALRDVNAGETAIGIVREKQELSVTVELEDRPRRRARVTRPA